MNNLDKLKKDINLLPNIIVPLNKGKGDNYYTRLEKKCLELQQELEKQKDNFENNEEYQKYYTLLKKYKNKINRLAVKQHIDSVAQKIHNSPKKRIPKPQSPQQHNNIISSALSSITKNPKNPNNKTIIGQNSTENKELTLMLSPNLKITNKSLSKRSILDYDVINTMSSPSSKIHLHTPQIYEIQIINKDYTYTTYCVGYINMFKLAEYQKNNLTNIPNSKEAQNYYDSVKQMLTINNINTALKDNLGNIGYLEPFTINSFTDTKETGYKQIFNNETFNSLANNKYHEFITKNPNNTVKHISTSENTLEKKSTELIRVGRLTSNQNPSKEYVEQYLSRVSTFSENGKTSYAPDKIFWSNINFGKLRTDIKYASFVLKTLSSEEIFKQNYIGSFDDNNYRRFYNLKFSMLNNSENKNPNFPTPNSIDIK